MFCFCFKIERFWKGINTLKREICYFEEMCTRVVIVLLYSGTSVWKWNSITFELFKHTVNKRTLHRSSLYRKRKNFMKLKGFSKFLENVETVENVTGFHTKNVTTSWTTEQFSFDQLFRRYCCVTTNFPKYLTVFQKKLTLHDNCVRDDSYFFIIIFWRI